MATRADLHPDLGKATDRLIEACSGAGCIRFDPESDTPIDALAAGVAAIGRIYARASAPRDKSRSK